MHARRDVDYLDYSGVFDEWFHLELRSSGKVGAVSSPAWRVERARSKSIKGESWAILTEYRF